MSDAMTQKKLFGALNRYLGRYLALPLLKVYRAVFSPVMAALGSECRFYPSCSHYAEEAYRIHGFAKGTALTAVRVARCSPLSTGGVDPVPGSELAREVQQEKNADLAGNHVNCADAPEYSNAPANHSG
jgi:putative membrane protein insertion efficiency factor